MNGIITILRQRNQVVERAIFILFERPTKQKFGS